MCNFGSGHHEVHFCEIILNLDQWFKRCRLKYFLNLELWRPYLVGRNHFCNFGGGH